MSGLFAGTPWERPVTCETCGKPRAECACPRDASCSLCRPADQPARIRREKRRGSTVTVVSGLDPAASDLPALLKQCRRRCAAGGAVREDGFEVQGDHRALLVELLRDLGYPAKPAGG